MMARRTAQLSLEYTSLTLSLEVSQSLVDLVMIGIDTMRVTMAAGALAMPKAFAQSGYIAGTARL
jgi:hypothetical protein